MDSRHHIGSVEYKNGIIDQVLTSQGYVELEYTVPTSIYRTGTESNNTIQKAITVGSDATVPNNRIVIYEGGQLVCMDNGFTVDLGGTYEAWIKTFPLTGFKTFYALKDHLGSTRVIFSDVNNNGNVNSSEIINTVEYYPFGARMEGNWNDDTRYNYLFTGQERQRRFGLGYDRYGARFCDPTIGRWMGIDPKSEFYYPYSPYSYVLNRPINAIDPDGALVVFVNGFMVTDWMKGDNRKTITQYNQGLGGYYTTKNPGYSPYPPSRSFTRNAPRHNGNFFDYWGGVDDAIMSGFGDNNAIYANASAGNTSQASDRLAEGKAAALDLISKLNNGDISLASDETIKVIGHSQGAAFAAGMLTVLAESDYASRLETGLYLAPHQPGDFSHPSGVNGVQWSTESDWVSSNDWRLFGLNGGSSLSMISGVSTMYQRGNYNGGRGGHSVDTYLDNVVRYFRRQGVKVNVIE